jgi:hypothetical protein
MLQVACIHETECTKYTNCSSSTSSSSSSSSSKVAEKIVRYENLTIEILHMQNVKPKVIPVIIGATGTI